MAILHIFYDYTDTPFGDQIIPFCLDIRRKIRDIHVISVDVRDHTSAAIVNKVYNLYIDSFPSIVLSFDDSSKHTYAGDLSIDKFYEFYTNSKTNHALHKICSNLSNTVSKAIHNNDHSDYIEAANNAVRDIIDLVYEQDKIIKSANN